MRIAVISDVHGNDIGFEAVLNDLRGETIDQYVYLGDMIQGGPQPKQVVDRLRDLGAPVVLGNADDFLLKGYSAEDADTAPERLLRLRTIREWSIAQLDEADRAYIGTFQPTVTIPLNADKQLLCFHGSPASFDELIFPHTPEEEFERMLGAYSQHILTGGHTHMQQIRRIGDSFFFNPGSAGYAWSHNQPADQFRADPWAEYALLSVDGGRIAVEFRKVPFDVAALREVYRRSGRPYADDSITQYSPRP
ncbi:MAG: metallophosphoesterase family protein [Anaerolineae bacterium]